MPQQCKICNHPELQDINADIIAARISMREIANKYSRGGYKISYSGVRYHKKNHLAKEVEAVQKKRSKETQGTVTNTIEALDKIIEQLPEVIESTTLNAVIRALELRAKITGEEKQPPRIIIEWGLPFDDKYFAKIQSQYSDMKRIEADYKFIPEDERDQDDYDTRVEDGAPIEIV